jgi:hypothetical protein
MSAVDGVGVSGMVDDLQGEKNQARRVKRNGEEESEI